MKKTLIMIIFVGLLTNSLLSFGEPAKWPGETGNIYKETNLKGKQTTAAFFGVEKMKRVTVLARVDYFSPSEEIFSEVYTSGINYGGEITVSLLKGISLSIGASLFSKKGEMTPLGEETTISIMPVELGVLYRFSKTKISPYLGGGVGYYTLSEESYLGEVNANGVGYFGQLGMAIHLGKAFVIDLNAKYNLCNITIGEIENNIGGIRAGMGMGFCF